MNPLRKDVPLKLSDGREFTLVLDMEALIEAEAAYGAPLAQLMSDTVSGFVRAGRAMLYGAFRANHPAVTLRDAGEMFRTDSDAINSALEQAVIVAFPDPNDEDVGNDQAPRQPGKNSARNGARSATTSKRSTAKRPARSS